ncbi:MULTISPECIES: hypothetical protein [Serratia]|uniref:hypothetical protein n=1 Tax=Serratia TaxID=613 RepID=UPI001F5D2966|nr:MULTISPECIES: hypothetical protein [Serratia]
MSKTEPATFSITLNNVVPPQVGRQVRAEKHQSYYCDAAMMSGFGLIPSKMT